MTDHFPASTLIRLGRKKRGGGACDCSGCGFPRSKVYKIMNLLRGISETSLVLGGFLSKYHQLPHLPVCGPIFKVRINTVCLYLIILSQRLSLLPK